MNNHSRIEREQKTVDTMIRIYCRGKHGTEYGLCRECSDLRSYAQNRLQKCPFQQGKTTCANCPVHCYRSEMRERIRSVMRYAGPRMLYRHPIMALWHMLDGLRSEPLREQSGDAGQTENAGT